MFETRNWPVKQSNRERDKTDGDWVCRPRSRRHTIEGCCEGDEGVARSRTSTPLPLITWHVIICSGDSFARKKLQVMVVRFLIDRIKREQNGCVKVRKRSITDIGRVESNYLLVALVVAALWPEVV